MPTMWTLTRPRDRPCTEGPGRTAQLFQLLAAADQQREEGEVGFPL